MNPVSHPSIDSAWQRVVAAVLDGRTQELMDQLSDAQPFLMAFLLEASPEISADAADLLFHGTLVIWNSFLTHREGKDGLVSEAALLEALAKAQKWVSSLGGEALLLQKKLEDYTKYKEPNLMSYVIESIFESNEDGLEVEPHEQRVLLILLTAVVNCF